MYTKYKYDIQEVNIPRRDIYNIEEIYIYICIYIYIYRERERDKTNTEKIKGNIKKR